MSNRPSETFCILPWIHVSTKTNGEMRLCCTTCASSAGKSNKKEFGGKFGVNRNEDGQPVNFSTASLLDGWNSQYMKDVRLKMLAGEKPASCEKCFREESHGLQSKRMWETDYWSKRVEIGELVSRTQADGTVPNEIRYFDLRLGHKCNLRCTMCSPHDSSGWINDWKAITPQIKNPSLLQLNQWPNEGRVDGASYDWYKNQQFWSELEDQIPHIKQIYFAGGEPMLIEEHFKLLKKIIAKGKSENIELRYNSNGTVLPEEIFTLWKSFKRVRFGFSLDSFEARNTYIRYPANWSHIEKNLRRLDESSDNVEVSLACAVQALNIYSLPDFIKWKLNQKFRKINAWPLGAGLVNFHLVYHPAFLNVRVLPKAMKEMIVEKYSDFFEWFNTEFSGRPEVIDHAYGPRRINSLLTFMNGEDWSNRWPEFLEYIQLLDKVRGTQFLDVFPEFKGFVPLGKAALELESQP